MIEVGSKAYTLHIAGLDAAKPGKLETVGREKTTLASYTEPGVDPIVLGAVSQDFGAKSRIPGFATRHAALSFTMDQTTAQIALGCADAKKGLAVLSFTGVNGPSTLEIPCCERPDPERCAQGPGPSGPGPCRAACQRPGRARSSEPCGTPQGLRRVD